MFRRWHIIPPVFRDIIFSYFQHEIAEIVSFNCFATAYHLHYDCKTLNKLTVQSNYLNCDQIQTKTSPQCFHNIRLLPCLASSISTLTSIIQQQCWKHRRCAASLFIIFFLFQIVRMVIFWTEARRPLC